MHTISDIRYGEGDGRALDLHLPESPRATYIFIHGGGLTAGDKAGDMPLYKYLTDAGVAVATLNYRLMPRAEFPDFIEDCALGAAFTLNTLAPRYGLPAKFVLGGSSAGAYISMMLAFDRRFLARQGLAPEDFVGYIFDAGQPTTHFALLSARGMDEKRVIIDETAPLYHVKDARPGRPLLIITAERDMPARVEQNALLRRALLNFGYPENLIETKFMAGYSHCGYCGDALASGAYPHGENCARFILRACGARP